MKQPLSNLALSYKMQSEHFTQTDAENIRLRKTWLEVDTVDYWRHYRMIAPLKPLLEHSKNSRWLTIGDGRFGLDSIRLKTMQPGIEVLPTDISTPLLSQAKEMNMISDFRQENAEALSFPDESFDFTFCKESYHHFPRPYIALYEMLRVSSQGVILVEPNERRDRMVPERIWNGIKRSIKKIIHQPILHQDTWNFEESGNYIYMVSQNEIEKIGLGLQLPVVAFNYYNDYYEKGVEFEKAVPGNKIFEKVKRNIASDDFKCRLGIQTFKGITAILFKKSPDTELRNKLQQSGFILIDLPENP
ncbi:MAG: class I SAM-dependent methyltransferase, partial [Bacteroidota bacterium]